MWNVEEGKGSGHLCREAPEDSQRECTTASLGVGMILGLKKTGTSLVDPDSTTEPHPNLSLGDSRQGLY